MKKKKKLDIIYEDKEIIVINKKSGVLCISTDKEKTRTLYHEVSDYVKKSNPKNKIFIINRLDKDTSGIVLFAKSQNIKYEYQNRWDKLAVKRLYKAIVSGNINKKEDTIKSYLKETKTLLVYSSDDKKNGKLAITKYKVIKENKNYSLLDIEIKTGRKNQIRVHLNDIGHSIVGDTKYKGKKSPLNRLGLHAYYLELKHYKTGKIMKFECNMPKSFDLLFEKENK